MIPRLISFWKKIFCAHDWEPYGEGYPNLDGVWYNQICLNCQSRFKTADELERRNLLFWEMNIAYGHRSKGQNL
jgi:hypothetical protein